jgi:hypothetical protein
VAAAVAPTNLATFVAGRPRQGLRLLLQQLVHGSIRAAADQFPDLTLDNFLIQLYNFLGHSLLSPFECLCGNFILPEPASYVFFYAIFNLRNLLYIIKLLSAAGLADQQLLTKRSPSLEGDLSLSKRSLAGSLSDRLNRAGANSVSNMAGSHSSQFSL